ncbi:MAG: 6-phosphogluconolactonase [Candidatus Limnocylindrales bacterium]
MAGVVVVAGPDDVADEAARMFVAVAAEAIAGRGVAHIALTGGSTVPGLYRRLLTPEYGDAIDWSRVELWWGDDRIVPEGDHASHAYASRDTLLRPGSAATAALVHPFPIELANMGDAAAADAAEHYAALLRERVPAGPDGLPVFDLVLLGMGSDGHILSVFPGSPALAPGAPLAMAIPAPTHIEPNLPRLTINPRLVTAARHVMIMCTGGAKASRVVEVLEGPLDVMRLPAQLARGDNAVWLLDEGAAALLKRHPHPMGSD